MEKGNRRKWKRRAKEGALFMRGVSRSRERRVRECWYLRWNRSGWPPLAWIPRRVVHLRVKVLAARTHETRREARVHRLAITRVHRASISQVLSFPLSFFPSFCQTPSIFLSPLILGACVSLEYCRRHVWRPMLRIRQRRTSQLGTLKLRSLKFRGLRSRSAQLVTPKFRILMLRTPKFRSPQLRTFQLSTPQLRLSQLRISQLRISQLRIPQLRISQRRIFQLRIFLYFR